MKIIIFGIGTEVYNVIIILMRFLMEHLNDYRRFHSRHMPVSPHCEIQLVITRYTDDSQGRSSSFFSFLKKTMRTRTELVVAAVSYIPMCVVHEYTRLPGCSRNKLNIIKQFKIILYQFIIIILLPPRLGFFLYNCSCYKCLNTLAAYNVYRKQQVQY